MILANDRFSWSSLTQKLAETGGKDTGLTVAFF
jgi:hypothetical protein